LDKGPIVCAQGLVPHVTHRHRQTPGLVLSRHALGLKGSTELAQRSAVKKRGFPTLVRVKKKI
jgi:hypothetical protein